MNSLAKIKSSFRNPQIFEIAMTHKSWVNENKGIRSHNERLEFLGDAVLEFIVSKNLYAKFPDKDEGYLTTLRSNLVNTKNLAEIAQSLNLGEELFLSRGEAEGGGRKSTSLLANTIEALIGAIYLDQGLSATEKFVEINLLSRLEKKTSEPLKDAKSSLQELIQAEGFPAPKYEVIEESGPDHNKQFKIQVLINGKVMGLGVGKSKAEAEQEAARIALGSQK